MICSGLAGWYLLIEGWDAVVSGRLSRLASAEGFPFLQISNDNLKKQYPLSMADGMPDDLLQKITVWRFQYLTQCIQC